jgi:putative tryptophan/tyrosine transport system substrate-binding protein
MNANTSPMKLVIRPAVIKYFALAVAVFALGLPAQAQSPNVPKIGFLGVRPDDSKGTFELLKRELRTLGYIDGKNITLFYRNAENKLERLPALVDDLIRRKVDVLVVAATNEARAAKNATKIIPIVGLNLGGSVRIVLRVPEGT